MATTLLVGSVDCNDGVNTRLMGMTLGKPGRFAEEYGGPTVDIAAVGSVDTSELVESRFSVEVSGASVDAVSAIVASIAAEVRDLSDITVGLDGSAYTGTLKVRIGECVEVPLEEPWNVMLVNTFQTRVEVVVRREPWVYGSTPVLYDPNAETTRTNHAFNPSFEDEGATPGLAAGLLITLDAIKTATPTLVAGRLGGLAQRLQYTGAGVNETGSFVFDSLHTWSGAESANVSLYMKGALTGCTGRWLLYDNNWNLLAESPYTPTTAWQRLALSGVALAGATYLWMYFYIEGVSAGDSFDITIDDCLVEKTLTLGSYFDGDFADRDTVRYSWSATPRASTSVALINVASFDLPAIVPLSGMIGEWAAPLAFEVTAPSSDLRCFWAGVYPGAAALSDFVYEMHDKSWTAGVAAAEAAGWPDGAGDTVWSDTSDALVTTHIDTESLLPGEYLVVARCKTAVVHGDVFCGSSLVESEMFTAHVESTTLEWYPVGVVSLPATAVRGSATAPLYIGIKSIATGTMYINCVALVPTSWGMLGWRNVASHCDALASEDEMVYADDISGLANALGARQLRALGGSLVVVGGSS